MCMKGRGGVLVWAKRRSQTEADTGPYPSYPFTPTNQLHPPECPQNSGPAPPSRRAPSPCPRPGAMSFRAAGGCRAVPGRSGPWAVGVWVWVGSVWGRGDGGSIVVWICGDINVQTHTHRCIYIKQSPIHPPYHPPAGAASRGGCYPGRGAERAW